MNKVQAPQRRSQSQVLDGVIAKLCASLEDARLPLNHLRESVLPSHETTLQILGDVKSLLLPDHRLGRQIRSGQTGYLLGGMLEKLHEDLRQQVFLARSYDWAGEGPCSYDLKQADADALTFFARLPELRDLLALDVQAFYDGDPAAHSNDEIIFCYPGFEAIVTYRIAHELHRLGVPLLPRIMTEAAHSVTGCDIHPGATIGRSFFIDHATGVVIGETTVIGERVKLYQGVTLGALSFPKDASGKIVRGVKRHPTIEDDVVIYAGATILGGQTTIGRGAIIGGSCWITHAIPAGTKVMLQDPQMLFRHPTAQKQFEYVPDWSI